ncbi:MAG: DMT family protein [Proteobacteria bacterium]|nr:DMT family protein [Pseudomonadota bacterium]
MSLIKTLLLLIASNLFMTFAWYAHLKTLNNKMLWVAILVSWGIAFFEYIFQVPANRIGFNEAGLTLSQLKILQEVITLSIFIPFAIFYMRQPISLNFLWASVCMIGAVYFIFR